MIKNALAMIGGIMLAVTLLKLTPLSTDPIDWPVSLGWGLAVLWPLCLSLKLKKFKVLAASIVYAVIYGAGYFLHYEYTKSGQMFTGYDIWVATFLNFVFITCGCMFLELRKAARISLLAVVFGAIVGAMEGQYLNTGEHFMIRLALDVLGVLILLSLIEETKEVEPKKTAKRAEASIQLKEAA